MRKVKTDEKSCVPTQFHKAANETNEEDNADVQRLEKRS